MKAGALETIVVGPASSEVDTTECNGAEAEVRLNEAPNTHTRPFNEWEWIEVAFFKNLHEQECQTTCACDTAETSCPCPAVEANEHTNTQTRQLSATTQDAIATVLCTDMMHTAATAAAVVSGVSSALTDIESPLQPMSPLLDDYTIPITKQGPEYFASGGVASTMSICIIMVGLPARGKTFLAQKICRLLGWHGSRAKVLNIQTPWRRLLLRHKRHNSGKGAQTDKSPSFSRDSLGKLLPEWSAGAQVTGTVNSKAGVQSSFINESAELPRKDDEQELDWEEEQRDENDYIGAEHFRALVSDPDSIERRLYRRVLERYALDAKSFYANGGDVLVVNDDFATVELRREAEALFSPLATQTFYMEVIRGSKMNKQFNEFKVKDILEYPPYVDANRALRDFMDRVNYLSSVYTTLSSSCDASGDDDTDPATAIPTATTTASNGCGSGSSNGGGGGGGGGGGVEIDSTCKNNKELEENRRDNPSKEIEVTKSRKKPRYVKLLNSSEIEVYGVTGYTASRIVYYVMNLTQMKVHHPIYFMRHGESMYNTEDRIGGDSPLTPEGEKEASELLCFLASLKNHCLSTTKEQEKEEDQTSFENGSGTTSKDNVRNTEVVEVWTSQLRRAIQTVERSGELLGLKILQWRSLNEIHAGVCENLTYNEVRVKYPLIDHFRRLNKYTFRYPEGESYQDLVMRLEPVIMELENADRVVVVVAHQAVLRALLAYFGGTSAESCVRLEVPHRTVWRCTYDTKGIASLHELRLGVH